MKKVFLSVALALFAGLTFVSCDPEDIRNIIDSVTGNATLVATSDAENFYANNEQIEFTACAGDYIYTDDSVLCNVYVGANVNFIEDVPESIGAPFFGLRLTDTVCGTYQLQNIVSKENIAFITPERLLTEVTDANIFVLAAADSVAYLAKSGTAEITSYPGFGEVSEVTLTNVQAYYVPKAKAMHVRDLVEASNNGDLDAISELAALNIDEYFPTVTFSGSISARRMPVAKIMESLETEDAEGDIAE